MRDSINYNLKYFIMKMSGTKPMKNTMRKQSPLNFIAASTVMDATRKVGATVGKKAKSATDAATTKPAEGKPSSKPTTKSGLGGALERAKAKAQANKSETTKTGAAAPKKTGSLKDLKYAMKAKADAKKATTTTKAPEGKPSAKPAASKGAFAGAASKAAEVASKATPAMQLKKAGMKKKC